MNFNVAVIFMAFVLAMFVGIISAEDITNENLEDITWPLNGKPILI